LDEREQERVRSFKLYSGAFFRKAERDVGKYICLAPSSSAEERSKLMDKTFVIWASTFYVHGLRWFHRTEPCSWGLCEKICESTACHIWCRLLFHFPSDPQRLRTDAELISVLQRAWLLPRDGTSDPAAEAKFSLDSTVGDEGQSKYIT
jgi:hypothetical protein